MLLCFAIWGFYTWRLNKLGLKRDTESPDTTPYWIKKLENISGPGIVVYSLTMTAAVIYWVMSMDVTWFSSVYGLLFLVGQGYSVLALSILTSISLSKGEPFKTILRTTEQHDLGKFTFAFVMLNIYLGFASSLSSGPATCPKRFRGISIAFAATGASSSPSTSSSIGSSRSRCLLSRDIKRNKKRLVRVCQWMIFAKAFDLFWLIEPNFKDAARNLHFSWGILEYIAVPARHGFPMGRFL